MTDHLKFPVFELVGPPCEEPGCTGVLVDHVTLKSQEFFRRCAVCGREFHRMPAQEKLDAAVRRIKQALKLAN
jgi:hypothetical protein